jgi:DNA-binding NarL/FixJ family response regulator
MRQFHCRAVSSRLAPVKPLEGSYHRLQAKAAKSICLFVRGGESLAKEVLLTSRVRGREQSRNRGSAMLDLATIKITQRDEQVLKLLVQGCSNKEIAAQLKISPRTVK